MSEGDRVSAQWGVDSDEEWFDGVVTHVHADGCVDVLYDDGDAEHNKPANRVVAAKIKREPAPKVADHAHLWPSGRSWQPSTTDWGTRAKNAFGCGKCRWRPSGCRGCIAAAESYEPPAGAPLPPGEIIIPSERLHRHCYAHTEGLDRSERLAAIASRARDLKVVSGPSQSDADGFGVVALRALAPGESLVDWSVFYIARPPDYALAHLPQFHALGFGLDSYFLLREPALGLCSLTYYVNEARHNGARDGAPANVAYRVVRPRDGGVALALHVLAPIAAGQELLANYDQKLAHGAPSLRP